MLFYHWKPSRPFCKVHATDCLFEWVPGVQQVEMFALDNEADLLYIDTPLSVSGAVERATVVAGSRSIPPQEVL